MMKKTGKGVLFVLGLIALQQTIAWGSSGFLKRQADLIEQKDIDPAAIFYTDSPLALAAEKSVRAKVDQEKID